jgi:hypothetical protein
MVPLKVETVKELTKISISRAIEFLEKCDAEDPDDYI